MTEPSALRKLFDQLADASADFQAEKIRLLRADDPELADELTALLAIESSGSPTFGTAIKQSILGVFDRAETLGYLSTPVGRYELIKEIGRGGMSVVFLAVRHDGDLQQQVALKMLRKGLLDEKSIDRFHRERKFLANLQHPNICSFVDSGATDDGTPYLVLELIKGQDLLSFAKERALGIEERVRLFQRVLDGVAYAHKNLIIHRDLKPSNVLVDQHGTPKLLDFGIANSMDSDTSRETERWFTIEYGAPEQVLGRPLTTTCDLYSAGLILFELLSGRAAFALGGKTAAEVERTIIHVPPPLMHLQTRAADELDCIVQKALRKEPEARYQTAEEFAQDMSYWLDRMPVLAKGSHGSYRFKKFIQRHIALASAAVLIVLILAFSIAQILRGSAAARAERDRATFALSILTNAFVAADPLQSSRGEMTVRDVLKSSSDQLLKLEHVYPEDFVRIGTQISGLQIRLGMTQDGQQLAARAYDKAVLIGDEDARIELNRARIRAENVLGHDDKAIALMAQESSELARNHPEFLMLQADVLTYSSDMSEKRRLLEASVAGFENHLEHPAAITAHTRLAELYYRAEQAQVALGFSAATLDKFKVRFGTNHPSVVRAQFNQLRMKVLTGQDENAINEGLAMLPRLGQTFGQRSTTLAMIHGLLAHSYRNVNKTVEAVKHNQIAVDIYHSALGPYNETTLRERLNLAITLKRISETSAETQNEFQVVSNAAIDSQLLSDDFRHYAIAYAALYFQSIGKFDLALETLASPRYERDLTVLSDAARKDFAQDLLSIATDAGCANQPTSNATASALCSTNPTKKCRLAVERYCALTQVHER